MAHPDAYIETLARGIRAVLVLIVPLTAMLVVLREPIVSVLFERLAFDAVATERTALALLAYAPQLPFVVVDQLLIVAFYARKQTRVPVLVGVVGAGIYLAVALATVAPLGMPGLALANAVQNSTHAVILYALLARAFPALRAWAMASFVARVGLAGALAAVASAGAAMLLTGSLADPGLLPRLLGLAVAGGAGLAAYLLVLGALRVRESRDLIDTIRRRRTA